eukprot:SAG11_NODE_17633_length_513_cov_0.850242_1_plen_44_part_10
MESSHKAPCRVFTLRHRIMVTPLDYLAAGSEYGVVKHEHWPATN